MPNVVSKHPEVSSSTADAADGSGSRQPGNELPRLGRRMLDLVGNTPLLRLERIARDFPGLELLGKAEWYNPGGSVKDRAASRIVAEARAAGKLRPGNFRCSTPPAATPASRTP